MMNSLAFVTDMKRYHLKSTPLIKLHWRHFQFAPTLLPTLGTLLLLPLLLSLGFWQLNRAEQKQVIMADFAARPSAAPLPVTALNQSTKNLNYRPITLKGHYDNQHNFLLDNRSHKGQLGYQVLTPFIVAATHKTILVNRGWIKRPHYSQPLKSILPAHAKTVHGLLYTPSKPFTLSDKLGKTQWPMMLTAIQWPQIEHLLKTAVYPTMILLDPKAPDGFTRDWKPTLTKPAKHIGYAVQWFAMSLTLIIIFIIVNTRKVPHD